MARQLVRLRAEQLKRGPNARKDLGDPEKAKALALSRIANQIHPLMATLDHIMIDGYRTHWGLELLGRLDAELDVILTDENRPEKIALMQGVSAIQREDWPLADKCAWVIELARTMPGKDIAAELGVDPAMVSNWRAFERLIPAAQEAVRDGRLGLRPMVEIAKLPPEQQPALLAIRLDGATAAQVAREGRRRRNGPSRAATVQARRIPMVLGNGIAITFQADGITLAMALDALADARKELDDAIRRDHDARTFAALMKKRARQMARGAR